MSIWTLWFLLCFIPNFGGCITFIAIVFVIGLCLYVFIGGMVAHDYGSTKEDRIRYWKMLKIGTPLAVVLILLTSVFPDSKQLMLIAGGYTVTNVENIDKLPKNIVNAANTYLETLNKKEETK